jgi:natural product precursor
MKRPKIKLSLNKETIAKLNEADMSNLQGGEMIFSSRLFCDSGCQHCEGIPWSEPLPCPHTEPTKTTVCGEDPANTVPCPPPVPVP